MQASDFAINGLCYKKGDEIINEPPPPLIKNLDELPFVAWDLLPMDKYRAHNWHCFGEKAGLRMQWYFQVSAVRSTAAIALSMQFMEEVVSGQEVLNTLLLKLMF